MVHIQIPEYHQPEVQYIFFVLFRYWLNVPYRVFIQGNRCNYVLKGPDGEIEIWNAFFGRSAEPLFYLRHSYLPLSPKWMKTPVGDLPVLFGEPVLEFQDQRIVLGSDLVATLFFFLTRWEEYLDGEVDEHGRFPPKRAWSVKYGLIHFPVVNGYLKLLKWLFKNIGLDIPIEPSFDIFITFDIDHPFLFKGNVLDLKKVLRYLFLEWDLLKTYHTGVALLKKRDPYWKILHDLIESLPFTATFYLLIGRHSPYDHFFSLRLDQKRKIIDLLRSKGVVVGLHPSYLVMEKPELLFQEKEELETLWEQPIEHVRFHYLRFQIPWIWNILRRAKLGYESSFVYSRCNGFRCGTGHSFPVFHCLERKLLPIIEVPPIFMPLPDQKNVEEDFFLLLEQCRKWDTPMRIVFHSSALFESERIKMLYLKVLSELERS